MNRSEEKRERKSDKIYMILIITAFILSVALSQIAHAVR